jgi:hypothetical protein
MLDYLPADLGEPKGEEVGVADYPVDEEILKAESYPQYNVYVLILIGALESDYPVDEPKGEEVGVADLLSGFPVAHCTKEMPPIPLSVV